MEAQTTDCTTSYGEADVDSHGSGIHSGTRSLKFLSLFAGIGGLDLGLERSGMECIGQVEIDPFCRKVLAKHWPRVPRWEDVRTFTKDCIDEKPDLICGGFPCQDISSSGKQAGIEGSKSGLWAEFHRIICELRPHFALMENVADLLHRGFGRVLGDLAESRFDATWQCLPAGAFGAFHGRDRVFVLAHNTDCNHVCSLREFSQQQPETSASGSVQGEGSKALPWRNSSRPGWRGFWANEPAVGRVAYGVPRRLDRLHGIGNAVVPQVAEFIGRLILDSISSPSPAVADATRREAE